MARRLSKLSQPWAEPLAALLAPPVALSMALRLALPVVLGGFVLGAASEAAAQASADDVLNGLGDTPATTPKPTAEPIKEIEAAPVESSKPKAAPGAAAAAKPENAPSNLDRVKAVPRKAMLKRHRLELSPMAAVSLNDPYYQHYAVGGSLVFYPNDAFGIGLGGDYLYAHVATNNIAIVRQDLIAVPAVFELPTLFAHLDAYWVPVYGKLSLFNSDIINFDFYLTAGIGAAKAGSRYPLAATVGLGQRFVIGDWIALRIEVRDHVFNDSQQVYGVPRSDIQNYLLVFAGVSIFVPPTFDYGAP